MTDWYEKIPTPVRALRWMPPWNNSEIKGFIPPGVSLEFISERHATVGIHMIAGGEWIVTDDSNQDLRVVSNEDFLDNYRPYSTPPF